MISKVTPTECFVYMTLPGQTAPVTAARFELTKNRRDIPIGRLVYGRSYLARADAVPIDPINLKLSNQTYETVGMKGVFGALRDAGPDYWGRRVVERHAGIAQLSEMDYLLQSPDDRAGALGFGLNLQPPTPKRDFNKTLNLVRLQKIADGIVDEEDHPGHADAAQVEELLLVGTSMGGARPKAVVEDADGLWIAKFNRKDDKWNSARAEHAMLVLARVSGMTTAESKVVVVGGRDVLMVKRFDRQRTENGYLRARMLSGLTLLRAEEGHDARDRWSYVLLSEDLRRISASPRADAAELFRRMSFNALISNTDDHPRNHAVVAMTPDWRLSPAYDLTPGPLVSEERRDLAMICGDAGRYANAENIVSQSMRFLLEKAEAEKIVNEMEDLVRSKWYEIARREGLSEMDCDTIGRAFAYPGVRYSLSQITAPT
jgi:serine/threonine-protein kinase HipA